MYDVCENEQQFQFIRHLGTGGFGTVDLCWDSVLNRFVAIKTLKPAGSLGWTHQQQQELLAEARQQAALNHPNIAQVYSLASYRGGPGIVMEYVEGETLLQRTQRVGPFPEPEGLSVLQQVAAGLQYLHGHGIHHGDLSAKNILLTAANQARLVDFGLSVPGVAGGTPGFRPPEWAVREVDQRGDIYSWGACLYLVLTGQSPPPDYRFPPVSASHTARQILQRATMYDADQRFQSVSDLLLALQPQVLRRSLPTPPSFDVSRDNFMTRFEWADSAAVDQDLDQLTDYPQIRALHLPQHLSQNTRLRILKLTSRGFTDTVIPQLRSMTMLSQLDLSQSSITDEGLRLLARESNLRTIQVLFLENCAVTNLGVQYLRSLPLRRLHLGRTRITDDVISVLQGFSGLRQIDGLRETSLTSRGLLQLESSGSKGLQFRM